MSQAVISLLNRILVQSLSKWSVSEDSVANTIKTITKAGVAGTKHHITAFEVTISAAAAANDITVELKDGTTLIWKEIIGSGAARGDRVGITFPVSLDLTDGAAANLVVAAGGAGVVTSLNMAGYTT